MTRDISDGRKAAYYFGIILVVLGFLLFLSVLVSGAMKAGDFNADPPNFGVAIGGMVLIILGGIVAGIGRRGLAGSGAVLDPKQAREDLEPYSRMAGGMLSDALDESGIKLGQSRDAAPEKVVEKVIMIKCPACGKLNEEDSKFCQECGHKF